MSGARLRVNVGCGQTPTPGFVNFDNSPTLLLARLPAPLLALLSRAGLLSQLQASFLAVLRQAGVRRASALRLPIASGSAELLYSSHMIEHLDRGEARAFLAEARRVLAPGGTLRLAVPDLRRLVNGYVADGDADAFMDRSLLTAERPRGFVSRLAWLLQGPRHHQWMYDARSLVALVEGAGFVSAVVLEAGATRIDGPGALDLRERESESLYLEARAPAG